MLAYGGLFQTLKDLKDDLPKGSAINLGKGEVFAYVGSIQTLKELKDIAPTNPHDPIKSKTIHLFPEKTRKTLPESILVKQTKPGI